MAEIAEAVVEIHGDTAPFDRDLDGLERGAGSSGAAAGKRFGGRFATAIRSSRLAQGLTRTLTSASSAIGAGFNRAMTPLRNFTAGFGNASAAASAFTGRMGSLGGVARSALQPAITQVGNFASGFSNAGAAASAFTGRMGTLGGGVRRALQPAITMSSTIGAGLSRMGAAAGSAFSRVGAAATAGAGRARAAWSRFASGTAVEIQNRLGGALRRAGQIGLAAAGVGIAALGTAAVRSASQLQQTEAALTGMYGSASQASDMMGRLRESFGSSTIELTAFGQGAQSLAYMGVEGDRAINIMRNLETALVTVGGGSAEMDSVNTALLKISNQGKATAEDMNMISEAQIPIWDMLATQIGTDVPTAMQKVTDGAVGVQDILGAMENAGGQYYSMMAAGSEAASQTMSNSFKRAKNQIVNAFSAGIMPAIDRLGPAVSAIGDRMATAMGQLPALMSRVGAAIESSGVGSAISRLFGGIRDVIAGLAPALGPFLAMFAGGFGALLLVLGPVGDALSSIGMWLQNNTGVVQVLGAALGGMAAAWVAVKVATIGAAIAAKLFSGAFAATPIGIITYAIIGLVAGFMYLWNTSEGFRNFWIGLWAQVQAVAGAVLGWFRGAWGGLVAWWQGVWAQIQTPVMIALGVIGAIIGGQIAQWIAIFRGAFIAISGVVRGAFQIIGAIIGGAVGIIGGLFSLLGAIMTGNWSGAWNAIKGIVSSAIGMITGIVRGLGTAIGGIFRGIGATISGLWNAAWNTVSNVTSAAFGRISSSVNAGIQRVIGIVRSLPGRIAGALGNLGGILYNAGASIINGLLNGLKSAVGGVYDFVGGIANTIASIKGPLPYDRVLLKPHGKAIIGGLHGGIRREMPAVRKTLRQFTGEIGGMTVAPTVQTPRVQPLAMPAAGGGTTDRSRRVEVHAPITVNTQTSSPQIAARMAADRVAAMTQG